MEIVTGYAGMKHVTANQQGCMHIGITGDGDYILQTGEKLKAEIITNNKVRIYDGDLVMQGRQAHIAPDAYEDMTISNGSQELNRNDIIVARYAMNSDTGVETVTLAVVEGTAGEVATDPSLTSGDIRGGDVLHEMALYRVKIEGLTIEAVELMAEILPSISALQNSIGQVTAETKVTLPASSWVATSGGKYAYTQTVSVPGITADDKVDVKYTHDGLTTATQVQNYNESYACMQGTEVETGADTVTFYALEDKPTTDIAVLLVGWVAAT